MNMKTVTSGQIQAKFGEIAELAKFREPVTITQYGRPSLLLMSYNDGMKALKLLAQQKTIDWMDGRELSAPIEAKNANLDEINQLVNESR